MTINNLLPLAWAQLWQLTLLVLLVALLTRWLARNRPHLAHVLWLVVLAKCVTPPLWSSASGLFCWLQPAVQSGERLDSEAKSDPAAMKSGNPIVVRTNRRTSNSPALVAPVGARRAQAPAARAATGDSIDWLTLAVRAIAGVWLGGVLLICGVSAWRWLCCWRMLHASEQIDDPELAARLSSLARRLKIRRRVRLLITCSRVGPAVVGLFRPTVILPAAVVEGKSPAQLEPILAHELLHIRRGDLWIGLVQTLAQALWWFHPLVWLASRLITREAERCCDEQVIAELGCPPGDYARSLLDVLALKQTLVVVPAFPGVRPVEVTSKRLERIMQLGQGCRRRTPWWCYLVLLVFAALSLPGAAFRATAEETPPPPVARKHEAREIRFEIQICTTPQQEVDKLVGGWDLLATSDTTMKEKGEAPPPTANVARVVENADRTHADAPPRGDARQTIEKHVPLMLKIVDDGGRQRLLGKLQSDVRSNTLTCPRVTLFDGQTADVMDTTQTPFVVGFKPDGAGGLEPQIRVIDQGLSLRLTPALQNDRRVRLNCVLSFSDIRSVEEATIRRSKDAPPITVQAPEVATMRVDTQVDLLDGKTLILGGLSRKNDKRRETEALLVLIKIKLNAAGEAAPVEIPRDQRPEPNAASSAFDDRHPGAWDALTTKRRERSADEQRQTAQRKRTLSEALAQKLAASFRDVPLSEVARQLAAQADVEIVLDEAGLAREGVKKDTSVSVHLDGPVSLRSILESTLAPHHLGYHFRDGAIEITDEETVRGRVYACTYPVADLVIPLPGSVAFHSDQTSGQEQTPKVDFEPLIDLVTSIDRSSWEASGGRGSIAPFEANLSLVISQTEQNHDAIADLFEQLRRLQDVQVTLALEAVQVSGETFRGHFAKLLDDGSRVLPSTPVVNELTQQFRLHRGVQAHSLPKYTIFSGQGAEIPLNDFVPEMNEALRLQVVPTVSQDRRTVQLKYALGAKGALDALATAKQVAIPDHGRLIFDVTEALRTARSPLPGLRQSAELRRLVSNAALHKDADHVLMLVTPQIIIQEEEEVLVGRPLP